jgi:metallo-beta-lactamase family protein
MRLPDYRGTLWHRLHPQLQEAESELLRMIRETSVERGGKVIIPSFAIGRTQEVVYALNKFFNEGLLPKVNIYVDSPLAVNATDIFRLHTDILNADVENTLEQRGFRNIEIPVAGEAFNL